MQMKMVMMQCAHHHAALTFVHAALILGTNVETKAARAKVPLKMNLCAYAQAMNRARTMHTRLVPRGCSLTVNWPLGPMHTR